MKKALIIGLIVSVLAIGGIGAAFATGMNFDNIGALSLGREPVDQVNVDYLGYILTTGFGFGVKVDGVYISFDKNIVSEGVGSEGNKTIIFVSLRDNEPADIGTELAYCVAIIDAGTILDKDTVYKFQCADNTFALPEDIYLVKVTVAGNSAYDAGTQLTQGQGPFEDMPGQDIN